MLRTIALCCLGLLGCNEPTPEGIAAEVELASTLRAGVPVLGELTWQRAEHEPCFLGTDPCTDRTYYPFTIEYATCDNCTFDIADVVADDGDAPDETAVFDGSLWFHLVPVHAGEARLEIQIAHLYSDERRTLNIARTVTVQP